MPWMLSPVWQCLVSSLVSCSEQIWQRHHNHGHRPGSGGGSRLHPICPHGSVLQVNQGQNSIEITNRLMECLPPTHTVTYLPYSIHLGKKLMSKVIQKSDVLNMRCTNGREYCKYYLKYWSQGIIGPLDPRGGQGLLNDFGQNFPRGE